MVNISKIVKGSMFVVIFILLSCCTNIMQMDSQNSKVYNKYEQFLEQNDIAINYSNGMFYVNKSVNENDVVDFLKLLKLELDIIINNIANCNTTRTGEDGPFRRRMLIINNGNMEIVEDDRPFRLVYDPTHPDRIVIGEYKNYVLFPNVSLVAEMTDAIEISRIYENIYDECALLDINKQRYIYENMKNN